MIEALRRETSCLLSIDTTKAEVARLALEKGAHIINDISALSQDLAMLDVAKDFDAGVVLMHMKGMPRTMQLNPSYENVVEEVINYLKDRIGFCVESGLKIESLAVDPGIGFGKTAEHNLYLLSNASHFSALNRPVVWGLSRKSFFGKLLGLEVQDRLAPSLGALAYAILRGAHVLRVHDVKESCEVACLMDMLKHQEDTCS